MSEPIHIISLGAGVQSSAMALMAAAGELGPMPHAAIFADTQAEPASVMSWLDWLEPMLPFPVHRVTGGNIMDGTTRIRVSKNKGKRYLNGAIPAFIKKPDGSKGLFSRYCTTDYKIRPLTKKLRTLCDWKRGEKRPLIKLWMGISTDEVIRMKPSREPWIEHVWPLIDAGFSRNGCLNWMKSRGFPEPPRSACVFCPFHSDAEWTRLKTKEPEEFKRAVEYEKRLQFAATNQEVLLGIPFLHNSLTPLDRAEFKKTPSHVQVDLFGNECTGLCGV